MSRPDTLTPAQLNRAERTLATGTWAITAGAILFSVLTVTPLVESVTPDRWDWTAPILPVVVDAAVVIVVRLDSTVARLGGRAGFWPGLLRWMTGLMTLALNVGNSALSGDAVGVAVHAVAPLLLIVTAEAGLSYRRSITKALDHNERERRAEKDREQAALEQREQQQRDRDEQRERQAREHAEHLDRERREHEDRLAREHAVFEAEQRREDRDHEARLVQLRADREAAERRDEQQRREQEAAEERRQQLARQRERERVHAAQPSRVRPLVNASVASVNGSPQQPVNTEQEPVNGSVNTEHQRPLNTAKAAVNKLPEDEARAAVRNPVNTNASVRDLADLTGWSVGWINARRRELRESPPSANGAPE